MLRILAAALALGLSPAMAVAQDWTVDHDASSVGFETTAFGGPVSGRFAAWTAAITLDPAALDGARISASVETGSGATGNGEVDAPMLGDDGLAPAAHPLARFESSDIRASDTGYEAHGVLTIRDASQPVILPFTLEIADGHAIADARLTIARSDYGVGTAGWGSTAANVTLVLHIEADAAE
ncbi:YceI family protein [Maricaulis sp.]|uniref:YceI family protein n=1 Tax=Maricaulis sp. TaxID=1486257 RepID=UPI003A93D268